MLDLEAQMLMQKRVKFELAFLWKVEIRKLSFEQYG